MIKANELRIGNWVTAPAFEDPFQVDITAFTQSEHLSPILLTEEWLLKFGFEYWITGEFEKEIHKEYFKHKNLPDRMNFYLPYKHFSIYIGAITVEYVHQLQNLYFALTGKEL